MTRIGFMQGRLSPMIDNKIQAFPWPYWQAEFQAAAALGFGCMEWTLDQHRLAEAPLMTAAGQAEIRDLSRRHGIGIPSVTGDCFMQAPFWKTTGAARVALLDDFANIIEACGQIGVRVIVVPLVDNGSLESVAQRVVLQSGLAALVPRLRDVGIAIAFESDFSPRDLAEFIAAYPPDCFGINYDIGNSASLGWNPDEELALIGGRVMNVHVKDRMLGGTTVPLGDGAADLDKVFELLKSLGYGGNFILQTARAADGDHGGALARYRDLVMALVAR